jgi:hypothetical protein
MLMKNYEIYESAKALLDAFTDTTQYLPIKINFFIQKNKNILINLAQDIEMIRMNIIQTYGMPSEDNDN